MKEDNSKKQDINQNELKFYYNREERLAMADRYIPVYDRRPFWKNKALMILLLDTTVIILIFLIYHFFISPVSGEIRQDGYVISMDAVYFNDSIIGYIDVKTSDDKRDSSPVFYWGRDKNNINTVLPVVLSEKEDSMSKRFSFNIKNVKNNDSHTVDFYVLLNLGDNTFVLHKKLKEK